MFTYVHTYIYTDMHICIYALINKAPALSAGMPPRTSAELPAERPAGCYCYATLADMYIYIYICICICTCMYIYI